VAYPVSKKHNLAYFASGGLDKLLKVWYAKTGILYKTLKGHTSLIACIDSVKEGVIASGSHDKTTRVWNIHTGDCLYVLTDPTEVCGISVINQNIIATALCTGANIVNVWDLDTRKKLYGLSGHSNTVWTVLRISDKQVVSGGADGVINVWEISTSFLRKKHKKLKSWSEHTDWVLSVCYISETKFASCGSDNVIVIYDVRDKQEPMVLQGHVDDVNSITSINESTLVSCSRDETVRVWDIRTGECIKIITSPGRLGWKGVSVVDHNRVACGLMNGDIIVFDTSDWTPVRTLSKAHVGEIYWIH
jgi:WD40 repeat protein